MVRILGAIVLLMVCSGAGAVTTLESLRVYAIEPASFDYTFTAIVASTSTNPVLSFNHRGGRTYFVHPGEALGDYRVSDFQPVITRVFNPTIKLEQEQRSGRVTLRSTKAPPVVLELGRRLQRPGWMAYLVNLTDGNWWTVKETDTIVSGEFSIQVGMVESNSVTVFARGGTNRVPLIATNEASKLTALWDAHTRRRTEGTLAAEPEKQEESDVFAPVPPAPRQEPVFPPSPRTVVMRYPSRTFFGTDYSCPTEYSVLPAIWSGAGTLIRPTIVVPRRFETRSTGFAVEYH